MAESEVERGPCSPQALARTYSHPSYADPWEVVEDYQRVLEYTGGNPEAGSSAVASALDLPRGRVRPWLDGSIPDCIRAIQVAEQHNWTTTDLASDTFRGLNIFVAWVFSGGSISQKYYVPYFAIRNDSDRELLDRVADAVGIKLDVTRSASENRAQEMRPAEHASILGRVLSVLGAPVGEKNEQAAITLPEYLSDAPHRVRQEFCQIYLNNRGQSHPNKDTLTFREQRSERYLRSLAELFRSLTGENVTVSKHNIILSADAAREIKSWSDPLSV